MTTDNARKRIRAIVRSMKRTENARATKRKARIRYEDSNCYTRNSI